MSRFPFRAALVALVLTSASQAAHAQGPYQQVISANPFGLLLEFFNGEYERVVTESGTAGFGGSFVSNDDTQYRNADVFYRFYPQGDPLDGWAFGAKTGLTSVEESGTYFGFGFDVNHSWLLGSNENFYVGAGLGLKRLVGVPEEDEIWSYIPTIRLINVGFAF